jgi:hypothetical protein
MSPTLNLFVLFGLIWKLPISFACDSAYCSKRYIKMLVFKTETFKKKKGNAKQACHYKQQAKTNAAYQSIKLSNIC